MACRKLAATERYLGVEFPKDLRDAYSWHNGQAFDSPWMINGWEWLCLERIRDEWKVWKDLLDDGDFEGFENDAKGSAVLKDWWNPAWIPLTYSGSGDHHCLDLAPGRRGKVGQIIEMWHDDGARPVIASSFSKWFSTFADDLEKDKFVLSDEYGCLLRRGKQ